MPGSKALQKIQLGQEVTPGTAVAATTVWRGTGALKDDQVVEWPEEDIGILAPINRSYIPRLGASMSFGSVPATYQQIPYLFEASLKAVTPVADNGGSNYIQVYPFPTTAVPTITTFTVEGGDNQQAEEMEYAFVKSWGLEGAGGEVLLMNAEWMGRQIAKTTFTAALTVPAVEEVLFSKGTVFLDDNDGTIGTTQVSNTILAVSLAYTSGLVAKYTADGALYFSFHQSTRPELTGSITFEHNASAVAEKDNFVANTPRLLRLLWEGSAFGTAGTLYTYHTLQMDMAMIWESFDALGEQDGNSIVVGNFRAGYDPTAALFAEATVSHELTALP
jgi:hypothetical protein